MEGGGETIKSCDIEFLEKNCMKTILNKIYNIPDTTAAVAPQCI